VDYSNKVRGGASGRGSSSSASKIPTIEFNCDDHQPNDNMADIASPVLVERFSAANFDNFTSVVEGDNFYHRRHQGGLINPSTLSRPVGPVETADSRVEVDLGSGTFTTQRVRVPTTESDVKYRSGTRGVFTKNEYSIRGIENEYSISRGIDEEMREMEKNESDNANRKVRNNEKVRNDNDNRKVRNNESDNDNRKVRNNEKVRNDNDNRKVRNNEKVRNDNDNRKVRNNEKV
jgi:hypothetical protein